MGLDMYAYVAAKKGQMSEHYEGYDYDKDASPVAKPRELAYWRKHPNLHGWMHRLWESKGNSGDFNGDELELTWEDLEKLEEDLQRKDLPGTTGFFFGEPADDYYLNQDLEFVKKAKAEVFCGLKVFYNSSW
jgi:hypothetical protein